ncbi:MAG: hydrogenase small subunit [Actinomycetia bacterium]|nr:hydrogenase small subunit [Actinomycetes bacterium]
MAQEAHGALHDLLAVRGVSRRDFLKYCGSVAAAIGLSETMAPQVAAALEGAPKLLPALWINGGSCTGCTESIAQVDSPDVATIVLDYLSFEYFETIMAAAGTWAEENITKRVAEGGYIVIYEGSVMTGQDGNTLFVGGGPNNEGAKKGIDILKEVASNAVAVIAVGSCAVDGGWVMAHPNPAKATGVAAFLQKEGITTPVVSMPTCPVNPEWVVAMVVQLLLVADRDPAKFLELTQWVKYTYHDGVTDQDVTLTLPKGIYGQSIHDNCPRRGHFENGEFVTELGSKEEAMGYCLYKVGCKGPQTYTQCPVTRWNRSASWCVNSGAPCIGCGGLNWVDNNAPFLKRLSDIQFDGFLGMGNTQPGHIGAAVGGAVAVGLVAHGLGMKAAGRIGDGPPMEEMKAYDRKRMAKKGGDK